MLQRLTLSTTHELVFGNGGGGGGGGLSLFMPSLHNLACMAYTEVTDKVQHLLCIVKEHLITIALQAVAAIHPPCTKEKKII